MIEIRHKGDFSKTNNFLSNAKKWPTRVKSENLAETGVKALSAATPVRTGKTAASWYYEIENSNAGMTIYWNNSNVVKDYANIALLIQYGHGTGTGGYVAGIDYINPAMQSVFGKIVDEAWEVIKSV